MTSFSGSIYHAIPSYEDHLKKELDGDFEILGPGLFLSAVKGPVFWYQNCWLNPVKIKFNTISEAAKVLRSLGRNWAPCFFTQFRRGSLIQSKLPPLPKKRKAFPWLLPDTPMGAYTLLDANTMIASSSCSSPFPGAVAEFIEDREGPPSRAYLKLYEALLLSRKWPKQNERCLDAGASPGGWTWVLSSLGAEIIAVDRAPLDPKVSSLKGVSFIKHDAFTLKPKDIGKVDWLFCDVVCYPPRLYNWILEWLDSSLCDNFVCTIKMQGGLDESNIQSADFETPKLFANIPGSRLYHLYNNKHELTWIKLL